MLGIQFNDNNCSLRTFFRISIFWITKVLPKTKLLTTNCFQIKMYRSPELLPAAPETLPKPSPKRHWATVLRIPLFHTCASRSLWPGQKVSCVRLGRTSFALNSREMSNRATNARLESKAATRRSKRVVNAASNVSGRRETTTSPMRDIYRAQLSRCVK